MGLFDGLFASDAERDEPDEDTLKKRLEWGIKEAKKKPARQIGDEMYSDDDNTSSGGLW